MSGNKRRNLAVKIAVSGGDDPLLLSLVAPSRIVRGTAVTGISLVGRGGEPPYAFSLPTIGSPNTNVLPDGLSLNGTTGAITGTPSAVGHVSFIAEVEDANSTTFLHTFSINVVSTLTIPPGSGPANLRPGEVTLPYSHTFRVNGATGTVTWASTGTIPDGLTLHSTGVLDGTPTTDAIGISYFTLTATDGGSGDTLDIPCQITVVAHGVVTFDNLDGDGNLPPLYIGVPYSATVSVAGGMKPYSFRYNTGGGDAILDGLSIDPATGTLHGTVVDASYADPTHPNFYLMEVIATDGLGATLTTSQGTLYVYKGLDAAQIKMDGTPVGAAGPTEWNFVGFDSVTNDGTTTTITASSGSSALIRKIGTLRAF